MQNLTLLAAIGKNNELGVDNHLIWRIKEDLAFYKKMTLDHYLIMGRKTLVSLPAGALEGWRRPIVLSKRPLDRYCDLSCFNDLSSLLEFVSLVPEEFIVIGGSQIYKLLLPYVETMYLTEIQQEYPEADSYFREFDKSDWTSEVLGDYRKEGADPPYVRKKYIRHR